MDQLGLLAMQTVAGCTATTDPETMKPGQRVRATIRLEEVEAVLSIPNLRIFVCSAWTDLNKLVDRVGLDYVIMWRQKASDVVFPDDDGPAISTKRT